jgi:hypothetical protein
VEQVLGVDEIADLFAKNGAVTAKAGEGRCALALQV